MSSKSRRTPWKKDNPIPLGGIHHLTCSNAHEKCPRKHARRHKRNPLPLLTTGFPSDANEIYLHHPHIQNSHQIRRTTYIPTSTPAITDEHRCKCGTRSAEPSTRNNTTAIKQGHTFVDPKRPHMKRNTGRDDPTKPPKP